MLYLVYGNDEVKSRASFYKLVATLQAKRPEAAVFRMDGDSFDVSQLEEVVFSSSLFDSKYLIVLRGFTESSEGKDFLDSHLKDLAESPHIVLMLEGEVTKVLLTKLKKYAEKVLEYTKKDTTKLETFNIFALADGLGERNKQRLWVLYQEALYKGIPAEEIFWRFVGQVKNMLLVAGAKSDEAVKMHPFVLQKTKRALLKFSMAELKSMSKSFTELYSDARHGKREFEVALERVILGL